MNTSY